MMLLSLESALALSELCCHILQPSSDGTLVRGSVTVYTRQRLKVSFDNWQPLAEVPFDNWRHCSSAKCQLSV